MFVTTKKLLISAAIALSFSIAAETNNESLLGDLSVPAAAPSEKSIPVIDLGDELIHHENDMSPLIQLKKVDTGNTQVRKKIIQRRRGIKINSTVTVREWVTQGKTLARQVLAEAYAQAATQNWQSIFSQNYSKLANVTVHWPNAGYDFTHCGTYTIAFTTLYGNDIYLCRRTIDESWFQLGELAQTLVHEGAHTIGYGNECDASRIEVSAMRLSSTGLKYRNGYLESCRIE